MGFVIGAAVASIVIFLLAYITIRKPVFGETVIVLAVLMILASTFFYFQTDARVEKKKNLIPMEEIQLSNVSHKLAYGDYHKLTGHLNNLSNKHRLQSINLNIKFFECPPEVEAQAKINEKSCQLIVEKAHPIKARLSAGQSRDVETYVLLDDKALIDKPSLVWQVKLVSGVAR